YTPDHSHRWEQLAADMDHRPRAGDAKRLMPSLCLATEQDEEYLVARSAEHGDVDVPTPVLAAHVEPVVGGDPEMVDGHDEVPDCDDGLGGGIASGRYDIRSAAATAVETSPVADISDADDTVILEREGQDHTTTEASPAAKTSDVDDNIMSEREVDGLATADTSVAAGISNANDASMTENAEEDNATTKTSHTAKASDVDNTIMFERECEGYSQSDYCPDYSENEPLPPQQTLPIHAQAAHKDITGDAENEDGNKDNDDRDGCRPEGE
ncbi:hypothetical protein C8A00DRAFT_17803, partial [Chaetomidium leptoderma]